MQLHYVLFPSVDSCWEVKEEGNDGKSFEIETWSLLIILRGIYKLRGGGSSSGRIYLGGDGEEVKEGFFF